MKRRALLALAALALCGAACRAEREAGKGRPQRLISLSPDVTETLFEIGAGPELVAVSDYCDAPAEAARLPRVGTSITPNYEAIARLAPTLIVSEANVAARRRELEAIGPTRLLPWLTLQEVAKSVRELGTLCGHAAAADALASKLLTRLGVPAPANGPRVLLVLGGANGGAAEADVWFSRDNSLHGAVLRAAGARNAVPEDVKGPPRLSHERLLELDPDAIVILEQPRPGAPKSGTGFERFPTLKAVRNGRVARLVADEAFANGPRILPLIERVRATLSGLGVLP